MFSLIFSCYCLAFWFIWSLGVYFVSLFIPQASESSSANKAESNHGECVRSTFRSAPVHSALTTNRICMWLHFLFSPADGDSVAAEKPAQKEHHPEAVSKSVSPSPHLLKPTALAPDHSGHAPAVKQTLPATHTGVKASLSPPSANPKSTPSSHPEHQPSQEHLPHSLLSSSSTSDSEFTTLTYKDVMFLRSV